MFEVPDLAIGLGESLLEEAERSLDGQREEPGVDDVDGRIPQRQISWATVFSKRSSGEPLVLEVSRSYSIVTSSSPCQGAIVMPWALAVAGHPSDRTTRSRRAGRPGAPTSPRDVTTGAGVEADAPGGSAVVAGSAGLPGTHVLMGDRLRRRADRARVARVARVPDPMNPVGEDGGRRVGRTPLTLERDHALLGAGGDGDGTRDQQPEREPSHRHSANAGWQRPQAETGKATVP